jgi:hypothetical protein
LGQLRDKQQGPESAGALPRLALVAQIACFDDDPHEILRPVPIDYKPPMLGVISHLGLGTHLAKLVAENLKGSFGKLVLRQALRDFKELRVDEIRRDRE